MAGNSDTTLEVEGHKITVSSLDKILYPEVGFTKGDVINYYIRIAPVLLPHVKDRALTLKRYPNGVDGPFFYEKACPSHRPPWVETTPVYVAAKARTIDYCLANDLPTLVWAANLADLEIHTSLARSKYPDRPTSVVFDLDPGPPADIVKCCKVGLWLRDILAGDGLDSYPKTSGSKGLQIYAPLNTKTTFEQTKIYAHSLAERLEREHPEDVVSKSAKALRKNKVLVDYAQNDPHRTTVCVYSLRAKKQPTVSTPVTWVEVEKCLRQKEADLLIFDTKQTLKRVEKHGDLFEPVLKQKQKLPR
jgi:bifunctional non-homologous end joining protein LigD